jgi:hypothetical protein
MAGSTATVIVVIVMTFRAEIGLDSIFFGSRQFQCRQCPETSA